MNDRIPLSDGSDFDPDDDGAIFDIEDSDFDELDFDDLDEEREYEPYTLFDCWEEFDVYDDEDEDYGS